MKLINQGFPYTAMVMNEYNVKLSSLDFWFQYVKYQLMGDVCVI